MEAEALAEALAVVVEAAAVEEDVPLDVESSIFSLKFT